MENIEKFLEEVENNTYALDSEIDLKAIQFEEVAGSIKIDLPEKVLLTDGKILNQGPTLLCVAFWTTGGVNEASHLLGFKADKNPNTLVWYIEKNLDSKIRERGTYIINGPKGARKLGWIEGYTQVNNLYEIKRALAFGMPIETWTNKLSWTATRKNNYIATLWKGGWHHINIVGYSDNEVLVWTDGREYKGFLIVENTWGEKWGKNGYYFIPYKYFEKVLFNTKVSLIVNKSENRKHISKILENLTKEIEKKKITPVISKYEYFNGEDLAITDDENKNLFKLLQQKIKEGYTPNFRTIIWSNEDRTNARLLIQINNSRNK